MNEQNIGIAKAGEMAAIVNFTYHPGDILKITEEGVAIIKVNSLYLVCNNNTMFKTYSISTNACTNTEKILSGMENVTEISTITEENEESKFTDRDITDSELNIEIIGICSAVVFVFCISVTLMVLLWKKKQRKPNIESFRPESDRGRTEYGGINDSHADVYGDINEDLDTDIVHNPYYGGEVETGRKTTMYSYKNDNTDIITSTKNIYYDM